MKATTVKEVLQAVEYILNHVGWSKYSNFRDKKGERLINPTDRNLLPKEQYEKLDSVCLNGALQLVDVSNTKLRSQAWNLLGESVPKKHCARGDAMSFNDSPKTTKKMVINLVRRAINKA